MYPDLLRILRYIKRIQLHYGILRGLTHMDALVPCSKHSSPPPTTHLKNHGALHLATVNTTAQTPISCTLEPLHLHAHLAYSLPPTTPGAPLPHPTVEPSLATPTPPPPQVSILHNSLVSASPKPLVHSSALQPVRSAYLPPPQPLTSIHSSL